LVISCSVCEVSSWRATGRSGSRNAARAMARASIA
jgi:hypothetical protein